MRITNNMVSDRVIADLQARYAAMADTQLQISTGRRVNQPSDDPTAAAQERLRLSELSGIKGSQSSVASAQTALNASESSLEGVRSVLSRANELALRGRQRLARARPTASRSPTRSTSSSSPPRTP